MKKLMYLYVTSIGVLISGCMSLDERLASNDPKIKREAEIELIKESQESKNPQTRVDAINRVSNPKLLLAVTILAQKSKGTVPDGLAALKRLSDQNDIIKAAQDSRSSEVRVAAFNRITDQSKALEIARCTTDRQVKLAAISKISDMEKLLPIAFAKVNQAAVHKQSAIKEARVRRNQSVDSKRVSDAAKSKESDVYDVALVDAYITRCSDVNLLIKIIDEYGTDLTTSQCIKIKTMSNNATLHKKVSQVADNRLYVKATALRKYGLNNFNGWVVDVKGRYEIFKQITDPEIKARLLFSTVMGLGEEFIRAPSVSSLIAKMVQEITLEYVECFLVEEKATLVKANFDAWSSVKYWSQFFCDHMTEANAFAVISKNPSLCGKFKRLFDTQEKLFDVIKKYPNKSLDVFIPMVEDSAIADYLIDNMTFESFNYTLVEKDVWGELQTDAARRRTAPALVRVVSLLSDSKRAELLKEALARSQKVSDEGKVLVFEGLYLCMPFLDYLLIAENKAGKSIFKKDYTYMSGEVRMDQEYKKVYDKDWRTKWDIYSWTLTQKERYRLFGIDDGARGLEQFSRKYMKSPANVHHDVKLRSNLLGQGRAVSMWQIKNMKYEIGATMREDGSFSVWRITE